MPKGLFITFEGTEGCGKSTQVELLAQRLSALGHRVRTLREPGGTPIGEEIRHTLKHSKDNEAMTAQAELLLMNASRAQLVREVVRPALAAGEIIVCDRFYDSTTAYQGYGRQLDLKMVQAVIDIAVGETRPEPDAAPDGPARNRRTAPRKTPIHPALHARPDGGGRPEIFSRAWRKGSKPSPPPTEPRCACVDGSAPVEVVCAKIWELVQPVLPKVGRW